ncbi:hypothetical protein PYCC9005_003125 [Savitreella phatthalungensis]
MVKILTWNVASLKTLPPKLTGQSLGTFFAAHEADIVCVQEHKISEPSKLTKDLGVVEGYDSFFTYSGKGYAGVATYVRKGGTRWWTDRPFSDPLGGSKEGRVADVLRPRAQVVDVDEDADVSRGRCVLTDHIDFLVLNIYAPNAGRGDLFLKRKMQFYDDMSDCVRKWRAAGRKVIVTGDINTAPTPLDIYHPAKFEKHTGFLPQERAYIVKFCKDHNAVDAFRLLHPDERKYSFWDYRTQQRPLDNGWRIDLHLASRELLVETAGEADGKKSKTETMTSGVDPDNSNVLRPGEKFINGVKSDVLKNVHGSDHCPITLEMPQYKLRTDLPQLKDAASALKQFGHGRIDSFFSKSQATLLSPPAKRAVTETTDQSRETKRPKT